eukprot:UN22789
MKSLTQLSKDEMNNYQNFVERIKTRVRMIWNEWRITTNSLFHKKPNLNDQIQKQEETSIELENLKRQLVSEKERYVVANSKIKTSLKLLLSEHNIAAPDFYTFDVCLNEVSKLLNGNLKNKCRNSVPRLAIQHLKSEWIQSEQKGT